jgi:hypothetical protein
MDNPAALDTLAAAAIREAANLRQIVVSDEMDPMEILLEHFRETARRVLQSDATVLYTIAKRRISFTDQSEALPGVMLIQLKADNRDALREQNGAQIAAPWPEDPHWLYPAQYESPCAFRVHRENAAEQAARFFGALTFCLVRSGIPQKRR